MKTFVVLSWVSLGLVLLVVPSCKSHKDVQAPPAAGAEQTWSAVATGSNAFAADLYVKLAAQEKGNLFFSPLSIHTALAMTYGGAASTTADQMAQTLHLSLPPDKLAHPYGELLSRVNAQPADGKPKSCELVLANALWGQAGYAFKQNFVATLQDAYGASLNQVNFGRPDAACAAINDWVAKHTNNKIREIVSGDSVNDQTRLILTNAIYFKGTWRTQFDPNETKDRPFQIAKDGWITVPMMHLEDRLGYLEQDDFQMVELPYLKNELSMFVIVPWKAENLARVEKSLTAANLGKWFKDAKRTLVDVTFPKFTSCTQFMLADTLRSMGMTDAFGGSADFSGMTDKNKLFISSVAHKAFVAVDEEGTEAAAATGGG